VHLLQCTPPSLVDQGVEILDATLHAALRITVGEGGGFGPLQDEIASPPYVHGRFGSPAGPRHSACRVLGEYSAVSAAARGDAWGVRGSTSPGSQRGANEVP
jgi:hypothetical protein